MLPRAARPVAVAAGRRRSRSSWCCCRRRRRSRSTTSRAGRGSTFVPLAACQALRPVRARGHRPARDRRAAGQDARAACRPAALRRARACGRPSAGCASDQEADGSLGRDPAAVGLVDPRCWRRSATASRTRRCGRAVEGWEGFTIDEGDRLRPRRASRRSGTPALAVLALRDVRRSARAPALVARRRLAARRGGDGQRATGRSARRSSRPAAGPSSSRTTSTRTSTTPPSSRWRCARCHRGDDAVERGLAWIAGMQSRSGGWGAFDVDNEAYWLYKLPFCDFGKVTDEPSADVTAHALEALAPGAGLRRRRCAAGSTGCSPSRRRTAPGSAAGASTTSTAPAPRCPRCEACGIEPGHPCDAARSRVARLRAERATAASARTSAPTPTRPGAAAGTTHAFPNRLGAISLRRCRRG